MPPGPDPIPPFPPYVPVPGVQMGKVLTRVIDEAIFAISMTQLEHLECIKKNMETLVEHITAMPYGTTLSPFKVLVEDPVP